MLLNNKVFGSTYRVTLNDIKKYTGSNDKLNMNWLLVWNVHTAGNCSYTSIHFSANDSILRSWFQQIVILFFKICLLMIQCIVKLAWNKRDFNSVIFIKNIFACNIFDPYICAVLCIVEHAKRPQLPNKRFVLQFIYTQEWMGLGLTRTSRGA